MSQQAYIFKWSNYDLDSYIEVRRGIAMKKRLEAVVLLKQAEAIDMECDELRSSLIPCPQKDASND